jgi:hypothetical protein
MPSIKIREDTLAVLSALRGRFRFGHSYDALITELVRREIEGIVSAAQAGERLRRVEEMTTQNHLLLEEILLLLKGGHGATGGGDGTPPKMIVS